VSTPIEERNRANAQFSTGPRTEEGKQKSSQNSRTHGLSSGQLFIPDGAQEEFQSLTNALFADVKPVGEIQLQFFEQLVHASWNTQIARRLLADALANFDERKINLANRYLGQYERSFAKALKELKALQTDMALRTIEQNEPIADLPVTCEIKVIVREIARMTERTQRPTALTQIGNAFRGVTATPTEENQPMPTAA
jgi:hypothetical protein